MASRDIEVTLADRVYVLNFGTNAACRLEEALRDDRSWGDVINVLSSQPYPSVTLIRQFVKASLVDPADRDKQATMTDVEVGEFIDNCGGWAMVLRWVRQDDQNEEPSLPDEPVVPVETPAQEPEAVGV